MEGDRGASVTVAAVVALVATRLADAGIEGARSEARWLVRHVTGWSAADLTRNAAAALDTDDVDALEVLVDRRAAREPLQLVLGGTSFRGHELSARAGVFVPRPETELLVEHALAGLPPDGVVVEPCTGSGAVACAIAAERPRAQVVATDLDPAAVALASANAARLGVTVDVRRGDLLAPVPVALRGGVDLLVGNPPYLAAGEVAHLPPEVVDWDPPAALVAGPTGHEVSDRLIVAAGAWLRPGGVVVLELDERRADAAAARATAAGLHGAESLPDLTGRPRFLRARRPEPAPGP